MAFEIRRGTNVGGWLSQSKRRGQERRKFFTEADVRRLAGLGFDHIRLPVDEEQLWDESGRREPEAWELLEGCLDWCEGAGMRVVVDLHILRTHYFNAPERPLFTQAGEPKRFAGLWRDLSAGLRGRSRDRVAYELMNEPVADDARDWNRVYRFPYEAIREAEPDRTIVLGSNEWSQAKTFDGLEVPEGDAHLILTFHYYNSMIITHYRAQWIRECREYTGPIHYPGTPISPEDFGRLDGELQGLLAKWNYPHDASVMKAEMAAPLAVRERTGLPLYCGEFGVTGATPDALRAAWCGDVRRVCEKLGIAWSVWTYKGGFGLYDMDGSATGVVAALTS